MIERQHTPTDLLGEHLVDEGLETGDYIVQEDISYASTPIIVMAVTEVWNPNAGISGKFEPVTGTTVNGKDAYGDYFTGVAFETYYDNDLATLKTDLERYVEKNKVGAIVSIFMAPSEVFESGFGTDISVTILTYQHGGSTSGYYVGDHPVRNKKLLQYPFNFLQVSNMQGECAEYKYEYFTDPTNISLGRWGNKSVKPGVLLWPKNYKGVDNNYDEGIALNNYPMCSFSYDTYKAWLAQNAGSLSAAFLGSGLAIGAGAMPGVAALSGGASNSGIIGTFMGATDKKHGAMLTGGLASAMGLLGKIADHATLPNTNHGGNNGDLMYQAGLARFTIYHKCITKDYAQRIDTFFDAYGYKVSRLGVPQRNVRPCYTYVKTVDCSLKSHGLINGVAPFEVPSDDQRKIEEIYNKGIRFWTTRAVFGVFSYTTNPNSPDDFPVENNSNSNENEVSNG